MMPIERELVRSCFLEAMRRQPQSQFENLKRDVGQIAQERGLSVQQWAGGYTLQRGDWRALRELTWREMPLVDIRPTFDFG